MYICSYWLCADTFWFLCANAHCTLSLALEKIQVSDQMDSSLYLECNVYIDIHVQNSPPNQMHGYLNPDKASLSCLAFFCCFISNIPEKQTTSNLWAKFPYRFPVTPPLSLRDISPHSCGLASWWKKWWNESLEGCEWQTASIWISVVKTCCTPAVDCRHTHYNV